MTESLSQRYTSILTQIDQLESRVNKLKSHPIHQDHLFLETLQQGGALATFHESTETTVKVVNCEVHGEDSQRYIDHSEAIQKMLRACRDLHFSHVTLYHVPEDYYERTLRERAKLMNAISVDHLCKSMIVENMQYDPQSPYAGIGNPYYSQYYCIVLQYARKLASDKLTKFITKSFNSWLRKQQEKQPEGQNGKSRLGKSNFQFSLAEQETGETLTGYGKGAILPIGMDRASEVVVILSHHVNNLMPRTFFMGGGEVDVKSEVSVDETIEKLQCLVADVTSERDEWDISDE